ncbi:hypothetical protein QCE49_33505, partial [Caballeronia sp. LZ008]|uniref:hypothetical protein n=1 Tax=unclassified Caballeronia TaxID=2646786 RepID=UPI0020293A19
MTFVSGGVACGALRGTAGALRWPPEAGWGADAGCGAEAGLAAVADVAISILIQKIQRKSGS